MVEISVVAFANSLQIVFMTFKCHNWDQLKEKGLMSVMLPFFLTTHVNLLPFL